MRNFFFNNRRLIIIKKFYILYLIISSSIIKSEIKIFPDHFEHGDEVFSTSQVDGVTFERFYYDIGYFTNEDKIYYSPKYGINYLPKQCVGLDGTDPVYSSEDRASFFGDAEGYAIRETDTTRSNKNKVEETKLYQHTMRHSNFQCPSPFVLFHSRYFVITYKLPMISDADTTLSLYLRMVKPDVTPDEVVEICRIDLKAHKFDTMKLTITSKNNGLEGSYIDTEYLCTNNNVLQTIRTREPVKFLLDFVTTPTVTIALSNYHVTIEDQTMCGYN